LAALIFTLVGVYAFNAAKILVKTASATIKSYAAQAANDAIYSVVSAGFSYGDFVKITRGTSGNILSISSETMRINRLAREVVSLTKSNFSSLSASGVKIPIGAFTGIEAFAGAGAKVSLKVISVCAANASFTSLFTSAGLNQTKHSISINVVCDITVTMFAYSDSFSVTSEVPVSECVIVGEIPKFYMQSGVLGESSSSP